jgi:hypothetical protein
MDRRVDVPVVMGLARGAGPHAYGKRHARHFIPTVGADLAARRPPVHHPDRLASLRRLGLPLPSKGTKAHIGTPEPADGC